MKLHYYDGTDRVINIIDQEEPFPDGRLIVSRTDTMGILTHCNQSFIDMSGYTEEELIGKNHYILRHPDMPAAAFKGLWSTVKEGGKWDGYVKNLRKDGSYYWVHAVVIPNVRNGNIVGYTSVRRKPSRKKINQCISLYAEMLAEEG
ncbi:MAG: PAS domain-containing protein [Cocleimonas sp.]|nr:PAS domain-containing protein [Cocleimonas sp.]